jgi:hypothetical protein
MVWALEHKLLFVSLLSADKELLFGDWSESKGITKVARNSKWEQIAATLTARGAVFKDVKNLRKVCIYCLKTATI